MAKKFTRKARPVQKGITEPKRSVKNTEEKDSKTEAISDDQKTKLVEASEKSQVDTTNVPAADLNPSLKVEEQEDAIISVPQVNTDDELKIEKETGFLKEDAPKTEPEPLVDEVTNEEINRKNSKLFVFGLLLGSVIIAFTIGYFYVSTNKENPLPTPTPVGSTETKKEAPEALNRSEWSLEVLNGTTKVGAASKIAAQLKEKGYQISRTGNADKSDYAKTTVLVSSTKQDQDKLLLADLKDILGSVESGGELKDSTASARIVIGTN